MTMVIGQEDRNQKHKKDHSDSQEECNPKCKTTTTMLGGTQLRMQEDDHDHNQEKRNQKHKMTQRCLGRTQLKTKEDDHDHGQEEATKNTRGRP